MEHARYVIFVVARGNTDAKNAKRCLSTMYAIFAMRREVFASLNKAAGYIGMACF